MYETKCDYRILLNYMMRICAVSAATSSGGAPFSSRWQTTLICHRKRFPGLFSIFEEGWIRAKNQSCAAEKRTERATPQCEIGGKSSSFGPSCGPSLGCVELFGSFAVAVHIVVVLCAGCRAHPFSAGRDAWARLFAVH